MNEDGTHTHTHQTFLLKIMNYQFNMTVFLAVVYLWVVVVYLWVLLSLVLIHLLCVNMHVYLFTPSVELHLPSCTLFSQKLNGSVSVR